MGIMIYQKYRCCFCNEFIEQKNIDPCDINVLGNCDIYQKDKPTQSFYCHFLCLKERLHKNVQGYFLESNFIISTENIEE